MQKLRDWVNKNPAVMVIIAAVIVVLVGVLAYLQFRGGTVELQQADKLFFTTDDGATFFTEDAKKEPPFDHNGKQAVRAHVFEAGGKKFVGYMERFTADALKARQNIAAGQGGPADITFANQKEFKRPGDKNWSRIQPGLTGASKIKLPTGVTGEVKSVAPSDESE